MNKWHRVQKYLFLLTITICILIVSLLLPGCGGGAVVEEEEGVTQEEEMTTEEEEEVAVTQDEVVTEEEPAEPEKTTAPNKITTSGRITRDETWSGEVRITGDISVDSGVTLTILPGTVILFTAHSDDQHSGHGMSDPFTESRDDPARTLEYAQSHIQIVGKIVARGTSDNMITFTSDSPSPHHADWVNITLHSGSIMEFCVVEYNLSGICPLGEDITVSHNVVRHTLWGGICTMHCSPTISHNEIYDCGHEGIDIHGGNPSITYNTISQSHNGMIITEGSSPTVEGNTLVDNANCGVGIMENSSGVIQNNEIITTDRECYYEWTYQGRTIYWGSPGIGIRLENSSPTIINNNLSGNPVNICIIGNSSPVVSHNIITDGKSGIVFDSPFGGYAEICENNIFNNTRNIILAPGVTNSVNVPNNWWGTDDIQEIEARIRDYYDDPNLGKVDYHPIATSEIADTGPKD